MTRRDHHDELHEPPASQNAIRRFDVFAEYSRQERLDKGYAENEAKGYGIWLAKVVAARRFGRQSERAKASSRGDHADEEPEALFRSVGDGLQTDETFDHDISARMGAAFYESVFAPAITEARDRGESYEDIRDTIRKGWKPTKSAAKR